MNTTNAVWNEIDMEMVLKCFDDAVKDFKRTFCDEEAYAGESETQKINKNRENPDYPLVHCFTLTNAKSAENGMKLIRQCGEVETGRTFVGNAIHILTKN